MKLKFMVVLCLFLIIPECMAIGIIPSSQQRDFVPGTQEVLGFTIRNTRDDMITATVNVEPDSEQYLSIDKHEVFIDAKGYAEIKIMMNIPESMPPGQNKLFFKVAEKPTGEGTIAVTSAVRSFIVMDVPYPGEYLRATISAQDVKIGEPVPIIIDITNDGTDNIPVSIGVINILGNGVTDTIPITFEDIGSKASVSKTFEWQTSEARVGEYATSVTVEYEGGSTTADTTFRVGDLIMNILDVVAETVPQGWRARVDITPSSKWNEPIPDVYVQVNIDGITAVSQTETVGPWTNPVFSTYIETESMELGEHSGQATLFYADKTEVSDFTLVVSRPVNMYMVIGSVVAVCGVVLLVAMFFMKRKYSK